MSLVESLVEERRKLLDQVSKLEQFMKELGGTVVRKRRGSRRTMSTEARERIAKAQRARWAKVRSKTKDKTE